MCDRALRQSDAGSGDDDRRAVGELGRAPPRGTRVFDPHWSWARGSPTWPRNQPSDTIAPSAFRPGRTSSGDVVGLDLDPVAVLGEARRELGVAGTGTVYKRLVDPVSGRVQPGTSDRDVRELELAADEHRRAAPGRRAGSRSTGAIQRADQSSASSSPSSNAHVSDHSLSPASVHTLTCHSTRCPDLPTAGAARRTRRARRPQLSTSAGVPAVAGPDPIRELSRGPRPGATTRSRGRAVPIPSASARDARHAGGSPGERVRGGRGPYKSRQPDGGRRASRGPGRCAGVVPVVLGRVCLRAGVSLVRSPSTRSPELHQRHRRTLSGRGAGQAVRVLNRRKHERDAGGRPIAWYLPTLRWMSRTVTNRPAAENITPATTCSGDPPGRRRRTRSRAG